MVNFTEDEIKEIKDLVVGYHNLNMEAAVHNKQLKEINDKLNVIEEKYTDLRVSENELMDRLHKKYGDFELQEIFDSIKF